MNAPLTADRLTAVARPADLFAELLAVLPADGLAAAREEILFATLKTVRTLCISKIAELIIDEGLADHARFLPETLPA